MDSAIGVGKMPIRDDRLHKVSKVTVAFLMQA
jgi:hypothetical protein